MEIDLCASGCGLIASRKLMSINPRFRSRHRSWLSVARLFNAGAGSDLEQSPRDRSARRLVVRTALPSRGRWLPFALRAALFAFAWRTLRHRLLRAIAAAMATRPAHGRARVAFVGHVTAIKHLKSRELRRCLKVS
jgi:hypothetical protein